MDFGNKEFVLPNVPDLTSMMSKVELPHIDPIKYEDTFFKEQADDVVKQISAQYGPQIEALNAIAKGTSKQVEILKQQLELAISNAESAKKSARFSKWMSVGAVIVSIASIIANVLLKVILG